MLNHIDDQLDNAGAGLVPQIHTLLTIMDDEVTAQSAQEDRTNKYILWPLAAVAEFSANSKEEVRGQILGAFIVDNDGTAGMRDFVTFLGNNFLLIQPNTIGDDRLYAFRPAP